MKLRTHTPKHTPVEHLMAFYEDFETLRSQRFDGMIVTGAPVEKLPFEEVSYWEELCEIFDWARLHVTSSFYICWAAQAALFHFYGVPKYLLPEKKFGVFKHTCSMACHPMLRGFDDEFYVPHSRHTEVRKADIVQVSGLEVLAESEDAGIYMVAGRNGRELFVTGHSEYASLTLDAEYKRDLAKGLDIAMPENYYCDNNPEKGPRVRWRGHANLLFTNWLNYYVYQETPYNINEIG